MGITAQDEDSALAVFKFSREFEALLPTKQTFATDKPPNSLENSRDFQQKTIGGKVTRKPLACFSSFAKTAYKARKLPAQGIALGKYGAQPTPCRGKSVSAMQALLGRAAPR